ncbi:MAG: 16S rRNA (uracil(1498)-N(3))-methyltransferase [Deltaproteobacteria bacterium]|nr:16S rRNA (uracil(1498)-N(3))-methyltransferase [Deltaproteobacteria bacterium]
MKHKFRFFGRTIGSNEWAITGEEYEHLRKVLRLKEGEEVEVFDGEGRWGAGKITEFDKDTAIVLVTQTKKETLAIPSLVVAIGALQPKTMTDLLPCLVELGVDTIHVIELEGVPKNRTNPKTLDRWRRILLSSLKQCKRATMPSFNVWLDLAPFVQLASETLPHRWVLDPTATQSIADLELAGKESICLVMGSESGLSAKELEVLEQAGFQKLNLGRFTLRSFTAALSAVAVLSAKRGIGT